MPEVNEADIEVAREIYGRYRDDIDVRCVGCIAEIIAAYRARLASTLLRVVIPRKDDYDD